MKKTKTTKTKTFYSRIGLLRVNKKSLLVFAVIFAGIGSALLIISHAATPTASIEPETKTITSPAITGTDSNASGGSYVQFKAAGTKTVNGQTALIVGTTKYGTCNGCDPNNGPGGIDSYAAWLGNPKVLIGSDNIPSELGWYGFEHGYDGAFAHWAPWVAQKSGRQVYWRTPMFPGLQTWETGFTQAGAAADFTACAQGQYNSHYYNLAANLKAAGIGNSIMEIGWESPGNWYRWSYQFNMTDFRQCWRNIAQQMKAAAPDLVMNWGVGDNGTNQGSGGVGPMADAVNARGFDNYYPGDDVVDEIGIDSYDRPRITNYSVFLSTGTGNLGWFAQIANQHNKVLTFPEWGLWDNTTYTLDNGTASHDDTTFIQNMHDFMINSANRVKWTAYFDLWPDTDISHQLQPNWGRGTIYPNSSALFKQLFQDTTYK